MTGTEAGAARPRAYPHRYPPSAYTPPPGPGPVVPPDADLTGAAPGWVLTVDDTRSHPVWAPLPAPPAPRGKALVAAVESRARLARRVPAMYTGQPWTFTTAYSVTLDVTAGDVVKLSGFCQMSNEHALGKNLVMMGIGLLRGRTTDDAAPADGKVVCPYHAVNVSRVVHHNPEYLTGIDVVERPARYAYNVVVYANSLSQEPGEELVVDYGLLTALVFR